MAKHPVKKKVVKKGKALIHRAKNWEHEERRRAIYRLVLKGTTQKHIAKLLDISLATVKRDLKYVKDHNAARLTNLQQNETIGGCLTVFEEVQEKAWIQYHITKEAKFLKIIQDAENNKIKLLLDVGKLKKPSHEVNVRVDHKVINNFTKDAQKLITCAMLKAKLSDPIEPVKDDFLEAEIIEDVIKK
jgi:predicted transcriptional regulator